MNLQQRRDGLRRAAAETAFGRDAEIADIFLRRGDAFVGSLHAVGMVDQSQIKLGPRVQFQLPERLEIGVA